MTLLLINIGSIWPSYHNALVYFKYFLGYIVCISNGFLNLIWLILAHVICIVVTHLPVCAQVSEIKCIYLFKTHCLISAAMRSLMQSNLNMLLFNIASMKEKASNKYSCEDLLVTSLPILFTVAMWHMPHEIDLRATPENNYSYFLFCEQPSPAKIHSFAQHIFLLLQTVFGQE